VVFFNNMTLVLERYFVRRVRIVIGKECNPLSEVELICDPLMNNVGILCGNTVIKYIPDQSIVKPNIGDQIHLTAEELDLALSSVLCRVAGRFL